MSATPYDRIRTRSICAALVGLSACATPALATTFTSADAGGDVWTNAAAWTPAGGPPAAGDAVIVNRTRSVTASAAFGDSVEDSSWASSTITFSGGQTLMHVAGSTLVFTGNDRALGGTGTFRNEGTYRHESTSRIDLQSNTSFINTGLVVGDHAGTVGNRQFTLRSGSVFENTATGTLRAQNGVTRWENDGLWLNSGGTVETVNGSFRVDVIATSTGGTFDMAGGTMLDLGDRIRDEFRGTASGDGKVRIVGVKIVNNTVIDVEGNGIHWTAGSIDTSGNQVENAGIMRFGDRGGDGVIQGSGTFNNTGTFVHDSTNRVRLDSTLNNSGTWDIVSGDSNTNFFTTNNGSSTFNNTGMLVKSGGTGTRTLEGSNATFNNTGGTVEVRSGAINFTSVVMTGYNSSTINQGTWRAIDDGRIQFNTNNGRANIVTIGADANVTLGGNGSIDRLGSALTTVEGTFGLWDQATFTTGGSLMTPGVLEFGLGAFVDQGSGFDDRTLLSIMGDAIFTGGEVFIEDLGLTEGIYRIIDWTGNRNGELTLANTGNANFNWDLQFTDTNSGFYDLIVTQVPADTDGGAAVPEPMAATLAMMGAVGLLMRRRHAM